LARRESAYVEESRARTTLDLTLDSARRNYNRCHARLTLLIDDTARVESCFYNLARRSTAPDEAEADG
jgi:hypothetical protein